MSTNHSNLAHELATFRHRWTFDSIVREHLGEFNFVTLADDVNRLLTCVSRLQKGDLTLLPDGAVRSLRSELGAIVGRLEEIGSFSASSLNAPKQKHDGMVRETRQAIEGFIRTAMPCVLYASWEHPDRMDALFDGASAQIEERTEQLAGTVGEAHSVLEEAKKVLATAKEAATSVGVGEHAMHFRTEAEAHETVAHWWLFASFLLFAAILGVSGYLVNFYSRQPANADWNVQATVAKVILYSTLVSGLVVSTRNYRAHRHNFVINRHRQNAMASFQAFAAGAQDELTKNAVLIQATSSIFSQQPTGYLSSERDSDGVPQVVEIIRGIAERKKEA